MILPSTSAVSFNRAIGSAIAEAKMKPSEAGMPYFDWAFPDKGGLTSNSWQTLSFQQTQDIPNSCSAARAQLWRQMR